MERGARIIRTGGRIAASTRFSNARRHGGETADFATATRGQGMAQNDEADFGKVADLRNVGYIQQG